MQLYAFRGLYQTCHVTATVRVSRLAKSAHSAEDESWAHLVEEVSESLGCRKPVRVLLERRIDQHRHTQKNTTPPREEFLELAAELEHVWNSPTADVRLKKRIVRTLIHEIVVDVGSEAGEVILLIHWKGGVHTELRLPRRRRGQNGCHTPKEVVDAIRMLAHICSDDFIAGVLNRNGLTTGKRNRWTQQLVTSLAHWISDSLPPGRRGRIQLVEPDEGCAVSPNQCENTTYGRRER